MLTRIGCLLLLLFSFNAAAVPVVTSMAPTTGPAAGGTTVIIRGSGFETCPICSPALPPLVLFGNMPARSVTIIDPFTLEVVTPSMLASETSVSILQWNGNASVPQRFTFTGPSPLVPVLFPVYSPPVQGAFGSEFRTIVRATNRHEERVVHIFGVDTTCYLFSPVLDPSTSAQILDAGVGHSETVTTECSTWPARFLFLQPEEAALVSFNVRVADMSRNAQSHGTEIPVVRPGEFTDKPLVFPGLPNNPRFRALLRVYANIRHEMSVTVRVNGVEQQLTLVPGETIFEPAYGALPIDLALPTDQESFSVSVVTPMPFNPGGAPPVPPVPIWGFITVTNNETQEITTITPDLP